MTSDTTPEPLVDPRQPETSPSAALDVMLGLAGAIAGGVAGYYLFFLIAGMGFYAIMLPGVFLGWGCGRPVGAQGPSRWGSPAESSGCSSAFSRNGDSLPSRQMAPFRSS